MEQVMNAITNLATQIEADLARIGAVYVRAEVSLPESGSADVLNNTHIFQDLREMGRVIVYGAGEWEEDDLPNLAYIMGFVENDICPLVWLELGYAPLQKPAMFKRYTLDVDMDTLESTSYSLEVCVEIYLLK